jgi:hypothetical protein
MEPIIEPQKEFPVSKAQIIFLAVVLILAGAFFFGRQFGWFSEQRYESVAIPSGQPYAEAQVIGAYEGVVLAERTAATDAQGNASPKKLEILTDEKTVFAKITSSGPIKIPWSEIVEGDIIWVYIPVRTLEEVLQATSPELAVPFEEMIRNPRERIIAGYIVAVSGEK